MGIDKARHFCGRSASSIPIPDGLDLSLLQGRGDLPGQLEPYSLCSLAEELLDALSSFCLPRLLLSEQ
jgi:hypothetical protein